MKVKHVLGVMLILAAIITGALVFSRNTGSGESRPEFVRSLDGGKKHHLKEPSYAVAGKRDRIFVADSGNHRVAVFNKSGKFLSEIGGPKSEHPLYYPYGIGLLGSDRLVVADVQAGTIVEYNTNGKFVSTWFKGDHNFEPSGIFVTSDQKVYVSDMAGKQIMIFSEQGKLIGSIKSKDLGLGIPQGLWVNDDESVWVADAGNYNVKLLGTSGKLLTLFDGGPESPITMAKGLALDKEGRIYVADTLSNVVRVFDKKGNSLSSLGAQDDEEHGMLFPVGLSVDADDYIYVADQGNNMIQVWVWK